ncbi:GbsR/MarR family transcriptional regulator [Chloroflexota bacterium]
MQETEKKFVEEVGVVFEQTGLPRMAGRVFGLLLICDPPYQSPSELAEALMASRGSISTMTRLLVQLSLIERLGVLGERHGYLRIRSDAWLHLIKRGLEDEIKMFHQLAEHGLALLASKTPQTPDWLVEMQKMHNIYTFLGREFPALLERWEREHQEGGFRVA